MIIEQYYSGDWVDISDYIVGASKVPYIGRNKDFTPRFETWEFQIAQTLQDDRPGWTNFSSGDRFRISDDTKELFVGYMINSPLDYNEFEFQVRAISDLYKLTAPLIDYDTLHSSLSGGTPSTTEYRAYSYFTMPTVHLTYLMKQMFDIVGLTLDTSNVDDELAFTYDWSVIDPGDETTMDVYYKDLFTGESELYCVGQNVNAYHTVIDDTLFEYRKNKKTFSDLIIFLCQTLGFTIDLVSTDNYELNLVTSNYSPSDDIKFNYSNEPLAGISSIDKLGVSFAYNYTVNDVLCGHAQTYSTRSYGEGSGLEWLTNFKIYFLKELTAFDTDKVIPITNCVDAGVDLIRVTTESAHGLSISDPVLIFGVAGMNELNNVLYSATHYTVSSPTSDEFNVANTLDTSENPYIEGGWIYMDTGVNYSSAYRFYYYSPWEVTANDNLSNGMLNPLLHQIRSKISNFIHEEILTEEDNTLKSVNENNIDIEWETSEIIQETYDA